MAKELRLDVIKMGANLGQLTLFKCLGGYNYCAHELPKKSTCNAHNVNHMAITFINLLNHIADANISSDHRNISTKRSYF